MKSTAKQITFTISLIFCGSFCGYSQEKPKIKKENSAAVRQVDPVAVTVDKNAKVSRHYVIDDKPVKPLQFQRDLLEKKKLNKDSE